MMARNGGRITPARVACGQMTSGGDVGENIAKACRQIEAAARS
jgi:predicted amidohydrolase